MTKTMLLTRPAKIKPVAPRVVILHCPGAGDQRSSEQFEHALAGVVASHPRVIVVDLSEADSISTIMLGLLLTLRRGAQAYGGEVRLAGVQPMVRRVLNICRLDQLFAVFSSVDGAMEIDLPAAAI